MSNLKSLIPYMDSKLRIGDFVVYSLVNGPRL